MKQDTVPKKEQSSLLEYRDFESISAIVSNYLSVIELIGSQNSNDKRLFKIKKSKKVNKLIYELRSYGCDFGFIQHNWNIHDFWTKFETLKCLLNHQKATINSATHIYAEGYKKCSSKKLDYLFSASSMIEDVIKAVNVLENCYRKVFLEKKVA